jgi:glycosyltransferase involved in cell wall biosynthesis
VNNISALSTWLVTMIRENKRWKSSFTQDSGAIRVFYGFETLPSSREVASGGVVKTQDMQTVFPNTSRNPNILYLISSALPPYAPRMARYAKKAGAKVVLNQNGVAYPAWQEDGWETTNRFMREVLQQADYVFYQSRFCKLGADRFLGPRDKACEVLYNPVDTTFFYPLPSRLPLSPVRLLLAGSHHHFYRVQTAIDTVRRLRDAGLDTKLEIAGRCCWSANASSAEEQLQRYLQAHSLTTDVNFSGAYTQEQARLLFQRVHILLHTKYNDPCPRLVVEAMASGLPVIYSDSGGTPELVGGEAGIGIPAPLDWERDHPPSVELLSQAVEKILADYYRYSSAARMRAVTICDVKPWLERHRDVFVQLVKGEIVENK